MEKFSPHKENDKKIMIPPGRTLKKKRNRGHGVHHDDLLDHHDLMEVIREHKKQYSK